VSDHPEGLRILLGRLAGRIPDALAAETRRRVADGRLAEAAHSLASHAAAAGLTLRRGDLGLLRAVLAGTGAEAGVGAGAADRIQVAEAEPPPAFSFAPGEPEASMVDEVVIAVVEREPDAVALWRTWRSPAHEAPWPPPERVYVLEVTGGPSGARLAALTARAQEALASAALEHPRVEVFRDGELLAPYVAMARDRGALIWAADGLGRPRVARIFDRVDPAAGPRFDADHPRLGGTEAEAVLRYLRASRPVVTTTARQPDALDPDAGEVVPLSFRTDGAWVWSEATAYYLERYAIAPDAEFLEAIRAAGYLPPPASGACVHRAVQVLLREH
jgi:hypothetical protein